VSRLRLIALLPLVTLLGACNAVVLNPAGDVAVQQRNLLIESTALMLIIIIPVMVLIVLFAWRYRHSNKTARYEPEWDHSTHLEVVIWAAPLLIIICLGALTWVGTHLLDPYRPIGRISAEQQVAAGTQPLEVQVVALDWKWLFIYPQYGIATVNELAAPVDRPINFKITASSVMNSFYIPALAGQVYAMPGMETQLNAVANQAGSFQGISANYSGAGFSGMHFAFQALANADFDKWIASVKAAGGSLDRAGYTTLARPSENEPVHRYAGVDASLYDAILRMCAEQNSVCMGAEKPAMNAVGGEHMAGMSGMAMPAAKPAESEAAKNPLVAPISGAPLVGAGLTPPTFGSPSPSPQSTAALGMTMPMQPNS
jgi:cytochrome o ubiquinol oxidase subunit 2